MSGVRTAGPRRRAGDAGPSPLATIWTVARYEVALQRRTPVLWLTAALLMSWALPPLLWAPSSDFPSLSPLNPTRWQDVFSFYNFTATWCALVAPLCALVALQRDRRRRAADLLWTRPLDAGAYVTGKALALALVLVPLSAAGEALYWILASLRRGAPVPPLLVLIEWACVVAPVVLLTTAVILVLSLVLRHPAVALLGWWTTVVGALYLEAQAISQQYGGAAPTRFPVQVGPYRLSADVDLYPVALLGCALLVLAIALVLLGATTVLYRVRERASVLTWSGLRCVAGLSGAALVLTASGAVILHIVGRAVVQ